MVMPIRNKSRKKSAGSTFSIKITRVFRKLFLSSLPYVLSLALAGVLFGGVIAYAVNSNTFFLEEVKILNVGTLTQDQAFQFCELRRGENLIALDLINVQVIKRRHPEFKE